MDDDNDKWDTHLKPDSMKPCWDEESEGEDIGKDEQCKDDDCGMEDMDNEGFHAKMMALAVEIGDDPRDEDWIPESLRRKHHRAKKGELISPTKGYNDTHLVKRDQQYM